MEAAIKSLGVRARAQIASKKPAAKAEAKEEMKEFSLPMAKHSYRDVSSGGSSSYITDWVTTTCLATWSGGQIVPGLYDVYSTLIRSTLIPVAN